MDDLPSPISASGMSPGGMDDFGSMPSFVVVVVVVFVVMMTMLGTRSGCFYPCVVVTEPWTRYHIIFAAPP